MRSSYSLAFGPKSIAPEVLEKVGEVRQDRASLGACTLLVDVPGGGFASRVSELQDLGLDLVQATNHGDAMDVAARASGSLALVMASGSALGDERHDFVSCLKTRCPDLPVLWEGPWDSAVEGGDQGHVPDACIDLPACTPFQFREMTTRLLRSPAPASRLVRDLCEAIPGELASYFDCDVLHRSCYRRSRPHMGADCGAVMSFSGPVAEGYLSVCAAWPTLSRAHQQLFGGQICMVHELDDMLRECANRLFGSQKRAMLRHGLRVSTGLPLVVRGKQLRLHFGRSITPYVQELSTPTGNFFVELGIGLDDAVLQGDAQERFSALDEALSPGEALFFE